MGHLSTVAVVALVGLLAGCRAAPTAILQPATQYYLLQPQPATLKIQPHLIQPIQQLKLEPKQYVYYYPSLPLTTTTHTTHQYTEGKPIRLVTLKQDEGNWWSSVFSFLQPPMTEAPPTDSETTEAPAPEAPASNAPEKQLMFMAPAAEAEKSASDTPAATAALPQPQRYYILSGTPQFYGNFDALQNPLSPVFSLQPLQAIHARAGSADIQAEDGLQPKFQAQIVSSLAPIAPVPAAVPAQLKNDLLESHQDKEQTIDRAWARSLDDEPQPEQQQQQNHHQLMVMMADDEEQPAVVVQGRSKIVEDEETAPQVQPIVDEEQPGKQDEAVQRSVNDPAIAAVKPSGIALAGRGGVAASAPTGTAIVGKNGLALASPSATSVAGNFFDEEDEEKKKPL